MQPCKTQTSDFTAPADLVAARKLLRRQLREKRQQLTPLEQQAASQGLGVQLAQALARHVTKRHQPLNIALYVANDGEIDVQTALQHAILATTPHAEHAIEAPQRPLPLSVQTLPLSVQTLPLSYQPLLPVLHPVVAGHLLFLRIHPQTEWHSNLFGIQEPHVRCQDICPLADIDLILLPLVGFDAKGNRLGMGGGFYDRTLAGLTPSHKTQLWGVAHDCQRVDTLPCAGWDIPLHAILTPSQTFWPSSPRYPHPDYALNTGHKNR
jgi:5-formyltetrahydrofolate cyclo-ligase